MRSEFWRGVSECFSLIGNSAQDTVRFWREQVLGKGLKPVRASTDTTHLTLPRVLGLLFQLPLQAIVQFKAYQNGEVNGSKGVSTGARLIWMATQLE